MDRAAITAWSYGVDETLTLLIPNVKGGATIQPVADETVLKSLADTDKADDLTLSRKRCSSSRSSRNISVTSR